MDNSEIEDVIALWKTQLTGNSGQSPNPAGFIETLDEMDIYGAGPLTSPDTHDSSACNHTTSAGGCC